MVHYEARPRFPGHLAQNWNVRALSSRRRAKQEIKMPVTIGVLFHFVILVHFFYNLFTAKMDFSSKHFRLLAAFILLLDSI